VSVEQAEVPRLCWASIEEEPPRILFDLFDEEVEIRNPPEFPLKGPFYGHDGLRLWASEVWEVFTNFHHEVEQIAEAGDGQKVVSVQRTQAYMRHTKLPVDLEWATVWEFKNGKVIRATGYMKKEDALESAGISAG
jgi:ketosteroid isomerase-like protein